ncbi:MAG: hypothetical protein HEQ40_14775 [Lacibacter sp.]|jgi:hypothetical protein
MEEVSMERLKAKAPKKKRLKIFLLKDLVYKSFSFNLAKQISYKQKQTRYGRAINFGKTKERKNE